MSGRAEAVRTAQALVDEGRFAVDLAELISRQTESQNPQRRGEMQAYLDEALVPRLIASGFACTIQPNPQGNPILVARRVEGPGLPTILGYGHGDVTRGQDELWSNGRKPFELCREGDRLLAGVRPTIRAST